MPTLAAASLAFIFGGLLVLSAMFVLGRQRVQVIDVDGPVEIEAPVARIRVQTQPMRSLAPVRMPTMHLGSGATVAALEQLDSQSPARKRQARLYM